MYGLGTYAQLAYGQLEEFDPVAGSAASRISAFNFCNPYDHILPDADLTIDSLDRQHLWGLYTGISATTPSSGASGNINDYIVIIRKRRR
jgi:hypothetical protein